MFELFKAFGGIVLRQLGPEDLPASRLLLGLTIVIYLLAQAPVALLAFGTADNVARTLGLDLLLLAGFLWGLLVLTGFRARYRQTLTALLGTGALLSALSVPFTLWRQSMVDVPAGLAAVPSAAILAIVAWSFVVNGHILSRALSRPFSIGLLIAIAYFFLHTTLLFEFIPAEP